MEELKVKIVGLTTNDKDLINNINIKDYLIDGGHSANICYTQKSYDEILEEPRSKTINRAEGNIENKHHSVFAHDYISLYFDGIPKIIVMLINNEKEYNTSEKSGRYTVMYNNDFENELYNKWKNKFEKIIKEVYPNEIYLNDKMISKKALENARYLLSIFMRTKMRYTTSFRQLNYLYDFTNQMINEKTNNPLKIALKPYLEEFRNVLSKTGFITNINEYRNRKFSLIQDYNNFEEEFGRSYSTNYLSTFPALADLQRHRSLDYSLSLLNEKKYYIPKILEYYENNLLINEWYEDISSISEYPQGMLVNVNETGKYEDFIMKLYERLCTAAQLEVMQITKDTLYKYIDQIKKRIELKKYISDEYILNELLKYNNGARCTFGFNCPNKCEFKEGITLERKI